MSRKAKIWSIIGAVSTLIALIVLVAAVFVATSPGDDAAVEQAAPATPAPVESLENNGSTGFGPPSSDLLGRKVMIPNNPAGQALLQQDPGPRAGCDDIDNLVSPAGMMIQHTFGTPNLFSTSDGPRRVDGVLAEGYSRTPQGAALAAYNIWQRANLGGDVALTVIKNQGVTDPATLQSVEDKGIANSDWSAEDRRKVPAAEAFRILSCDDDFVVTEFATRIFGDETGRFTEPRWVTFRFNMAWSDGDWKMQLLKGAASASKVDSLAGWTQWAF